MAKTRSRNAAKSPQRVSQIDRLPAWNLPSREIERLLAVGTDPRLGAIFGSDLEELKDLARRAQGTVRAASGTVLLVPGILGSTIGRKGNLFTQDTIWFDPVSIARGDITKIKLDDNGNSSLESLDVIPVIHVMLKLRLSLQGFNVRYWHYDWRKSIPQLGRKLATDIARIPGKVKIVAHSMGGLVARAALHAGASSVDRLVMLGTPNRGSFAAVEVLQGINSNVVLVDKLDLAHDAEELTRTVFSTFPSIYELLPQESVFSEIDLFDPKNWPVGTFHPSLKRLKAAKGIAARLVEQDPRMRLIAGCGQTTVTNLIKRESQFVYQLTSSGDGTVPVTMCQLPGVKTRYVVETHTGLLRNLAVAEAVGELLRNETSSLLANPPENARAASIVELPHTKFVTRSTGNQVLGNFRGAAIDPQDLPMLLETAMSLSTVPADDALKQITGSRNSVSQAATSASPPAAKSTGDSRLTSGIIFNQTVISRDAQSHLELELFCGNLFDVPYRAVVLGMFSNVDPDGPARALDQLTGGAVTELMARRMFNAAEGTIFVMPTGRNALKAEYVVFAGLGNYNDFAMNPENTLRTISCNVLRTLMNCGVDEFATLIYGGASGISIRSNVESFVQGFLDALKAVGANERSVQFRRVALCELDGQRYAELKDEVYRLGGTDLCEKVRLRLHEAHYPASASAIADSLKQRIEVVEDRRPKSHVYLTVRAEKLLTEGTLRETDDVVFHASLLGATSKAIVFPSVNRVSRKKLESVLATLPNLNLSRTLPQLLKTGRDLCTLVLSDDFLQVLEKELMVQDHLTVIVDDLASRIPWEIMPLTSRTNSTTAELPCLGAGLTRRLQTDGTNAVARYLEEQQWQQILRVLLVYNPTKDLDGAKKEGELLHDSLQRLESTQIKVLKNELATRQAILTEMGSGKYDVLHYAGHAFFDPINRGRSGLICHGPGAVNGHSVLSGRDLAALPHLPPLIVFNACESGRVRALSPGFKMPEDRTNHKVKSIPSADRSQQQAGICEAVLKGGVSQFIGTYWPVGDVGAVAFAEKLYTGLLTGKTVRESVLDGRIAVNALQGNAKSDCVNYIHYGDATFVVKNRNTSPSP